MKKILLITAILALGACSNLSSFMPSSSSNGETSGVRGKMQSCMLAEAQSRLQAGTLFNDTVTATAKDIAGTCAKKLALSSMGISEETQKSAESIITNLRNMSAQ
ncbi:MAG: hypothetical protein J6N49_05025 [Alphaproteobacteria bacterium]|nr:hypothetical protein [Alphaproteobacteria bacterium]